MVSLPEPVEDGASPEDEIVFRFFEWRHRHILAAVGRDVKDPRLCVPRGTKLAPGFHVECHRAGWGEVPRGTWPTSTRRRSTWNYQSGRLAGARRGYRSGHGRCCSSLARLGGPGVTSSNSRPRRARPVRGHRSPVEPGGSLTTSRPDTRKNGAAHSAVTAGGPKLRTQTASNPLR